MRSRMQQMKENGNRWRAGAKEKIKSNEMNSESIAIRESLEVGDVCLFSPLIDGKWCVLLGIEINAAVGNGDVTEGSFCFALVRVEEAFKTSVIVVVFFCIGHLIKNAKTLIGILRTSRRFRCIRAKFLVLEVHAAAWSKLANRCCLSDAAESFRPWASVNHGDGQQCEIQHGSCLLFLLLRIYWDISWHTQTLS